MLQKEFSVLVFRIVDGCFYVDVRTLIYFSLFSYKVDLFQGRIAYIRTLKNHNFMWGLQRIREYSGRKDCLQIEFSTSKMFCFVVYDGTGIIRAVVWGDDLCKNVNNLFQVGFYVFFFWIRKLYLYIYMCVYLKVG